MGAGPLSKELMNASVKLMPGGVNSPVRSYQSVEGEPLFIERAKGSKIYDADGREFIDYVMSWGPLIVGHAHPEVLEKIRKALERGTSFGAPTGFELELAKLTTDAFPSMDMIRFVNSGTEATMSAVRLARAATDRKKILKFDGCYHGHVDALLVQAGSGVATLGLPNSPGIPPEATGFTVSVPFNDLDAVRRAFEQDPRGYAAIIVEPVAGNMGVVNPESGFLEGLRETATACGALLIFDEVMTGFRLAMGGAQELFHIRADLTCLGKVIGGGLPVGAYGGRKDLMEQVAPSGSVYQAGTLSGNPIAMAGGIKTLKLLREPETFQTLDYRTRYLADELKRRSERMDVPVTVNRAGSMFTIFFCKGPVRNFAEAQTANKRLFSKYFHGMQEEGIYIPPSPFEAWFLSTAHTDDDIEKTIDAHERVLRRL
ncbi:MAG TPA: glutamate-1-semialdehyde 2,1-aminomutase [Bdellovibrionota bacterium]|nr:glutamate-1-semialdehyde 2,1-aminomutase [Bdellovibrionota bacterium]